MSDENVGKEKESWSSRAKGFLGRRWSGAKKTAKNRYEGAKKFGQEEWRGLRVSHQVLLTLGLLRLSGV